MNAIELLKQLIDRLPDILQNLAAFLATLTMLLGAASPIIAIFYKKAGKSEQEADRHVKKIVATAKEVEKVVKTLAVESRNLTAADIAETAQNAPVVKGVAHNILAEAVALNVGGKNPAEAAQEAALNAFAQPENRKLIERKLKKFLNKL